MTDSFAYGYHWLLLVVYLQGNAGKSSHRVAEIKHKDKHRNKLQKRLQTNLLTTEYLHKGMVYNDKWQKEEKYRR